MVFIEKDEVLVLDLDKKNPILIAIRGQYWKVEGECNRCGECCETYFPSSWEEWKDEETGSCKYLVRETVDDKPMARCAKQWNKPSACLLFPFNPLDPNHFRELPNCSFSFKKITKTEFIKQLHGRV